MNAELAARDLRVLWHPCTQMHDHESLPIVPIRSGHGAWLTDMDGNRYLDAISSWWVNLFGHGHPRIANAIRAQLDRLEHVILAGFTHEPAVHLAEGLLQVAPPGLTKVFYADNGSSAIEVALKMSFHAWRNAGVEGKSRFVALSGSYHGETLGALSVTDVPLYRETYAPLLLQPFFVPSPDSYECAPGESAQAYSDRCADALDQLLAQHANEIAAMILEPLVQGAAGMRMYPAGYLKRARAACDRYGVHLIADEIMVGFGRTGTLFACEQAGITPDFLCLSKGITGGFLPLAAVLTTPAVFDAFYAEYQTRRAFLHSHSYTGNPLACAAACEVLKMFAEEDWLARNRSTSSTLAAAIEPLRAHPSVGDVRQTGMIAAVELVRDRATREPFDWRERRGLKVYRHALSRGVLLRPLGNVIYFLPPYCISADEIALMVRVAAEGIEIAVNG
ncbi:MAG: adenosylmethionine--8-amino-7-oxononanoate transaminase [Pseudomonadota bacterium]|nr:adenosylmethionine--8-amino-7-oxononanoate transaminase [Pseudomonadota bacterium]